MSNGINRTLFREIHETIALHPEVHDQGQFVSAPSTMTEDPCGTKRCVAGWAVALRKSIGQSDADFLHELTGGMFNYVTAGKMLLGLDYVEAQALFYSTNDEEAVEICGLYAEGRDEKARAILEDVGAEYFEDYSEEYDDYDLGEDDD